MFSDRLVRSLAGWGLLVLLGGCSVREDRSDCPCLLVVDLSGLDAAGWVQAGYTSVSWSVRSDGFRIEGCLPLEGLPPELVVEIPRGAAQLTLLSGADDLCGPDGSLVIPEGEACPPLLAFSAAVDAALPEVTVPVTLHKRYARVDILFRDYLQDGYSFSLLGTTCGYDPELRPLSGPFRVSLQPDAEGFCSLSVPAQADGSLSLCVYRFGEMERVFRLGEYILDSGYDWQAEDLEDLSLEIDFVGTTARIRIHQWSKSVYFSIAV
ncbi:MAG: hypothetical protein IJ654_09885 [Bacteroidales bacterium]|nr:hypothetical protein [Bacteroidales bacterium]